MGLILVVGSGCSREATVQSPPSPPPDYGFVKNGATFMGDQRPEHWVFTNTPSISWSNRDEMLASVNQCLTNIGLPAVTNMGMRAGGLGPLVGGWRFVEWPDYSLGLLRIRFLYSGNGGDGDVARVDVVFNPPSKPGTYSQAKGN